MATIFDSTDVSELHATIAALEYRIRFLESQVVHKGNPELNMAISYAVNVQNAASISALLSNNSGREIGVERNAELMNDRRETLEFPGVSELDPSFLSRVGLRD